MIVSMITAVLPVCRSPMISSRWPRPIGISASIAFSPVCTGSCTDLRGMMPGAFTSTRPRTTSVSGPLPSIGVPSPSTTRPSKPLPTGTSTIGAGARDGVALADLLVVAEDHHADVVGFQVQRHAAQAGAGEFDHLAGHAVLQAEHAGDAVADATAPGRSRRRWPRCRTRRSACAGSPRSRRGGSPYQAAPFMANCRRCSRDFKDWCRTGGHRCARPGRRASRVPPIR